MGCITSLLAALTIILYVTPNLRDLVFMEEYWLTIGAFWVCYLISWFLFGDIADEIAGVNNYEDDEY
tara:strand:+ start:67 stop:267 length:201 start_codon:yes stop_codon:yes gene_type:complete